MVPENPSPFSQLDYLQDRDYLLVGLVAFFLLEERLLLAFDKSHLQTLSKMLVT